MVIVGDFEKLAQHLGSFSPFLMNHSNKNAYKNMYTVFRYIRVVTTQEIKNKNKSVKWLLRNSNPQPFSF